MGEVLSFGFNLLVSSPSDEVGYYLHREGPNLGKHRVPSLLLPLALDAQLGTPYLRSAGFDTDNLQEEEGELCIENQRERRSHLANNYGPECLW